MGGFNQLYQRTLKKKGGLPSAPTHTTKSFTNLHVPILVFADRSGAVVSGSGSRARARVRVRVRVWVRAWVRARARVSDRVRT